MGPYSTIAVGLGSGSLAHYFMENSQVLEELLK